MTTFLDTTEPQFVTRADWIPDFWNFLLGLNKDDLIAELVQNDLDQQASRTVITFEQERLISEGNGKPVDANGWWRLQMIRGAGDQVPAKKGKIGVKNHGLKTAFTIGDQIHLFSAGKTITQTLYATGQNNPPRPGASAKPRPSPDAPVEGCRVVIDFRKRDLEPREGEAVTIRSVDSNLIDELFTSACTTIPEQFAGVVSPEVAPRYEIILRHWRLGEVHYLFSCSRPRKVGKKMEMFRRKCAVSGTIDPLPASLEEEATRRLAVLTGRLRERVPDFFRRGNRFFVEVSWRVNRRGTPLQGTGRFRYPIGYPPSDESLTGHGVFFNAPFVSDPERHGPTANDPTNDDLRQACEKVLLDLIAGVSVGKWGPDALKPLLPISNSDNGLQAVKPLLAELAQRGAIPTISWKNVCRFLTKTKRLTKVRHAPIKHAAPRYKFVAPVATWNDESIHSSLALLCPPQEKQLDPRVDPLIISILCDRELPGFYKSFITFDEYDALSILSGEGSTHFELVDDVKHYFADPVLARACLDVIKDALDHESEAVVEDKLLTSLYLPNTRSLATRLADLHSNVSVPSDIPGLQLPLLLHPFLVSHPLFRRKKWRRPVFSMAKFLDENALDDSDEDTRRKFWEWLRANERLIKSKERKRLVNKKIWPDEEFRLYKLPELCEPRNRYLTNLLRSHIHLPHQQVRRSRLTLRGNTRRSQIRRVPLAEELKSWFDDQIRIFPLNEFADAERAKRLEKFESDLVTLVRDRAIARMLNTIDGTLPALAEGGSVQLRAELVVVDSITKRLALPSRYVLHRTPHHHVLQKFAPALPKPTASMLIAAFKEDSVNFAPLQARLSYFLNLTRPGDPDRMTVAALPILPVNNQGQAPASLAFMSARGDYWGNWKTRISAKGLSQDDQVRYLHIGVTSGIPTVENSQAFFLWLCKQSVDVLQSHIPCVLRQVLHSNGPQAWAEAYTDTPFIPTRSRSGVRLVSLQRAQHGPVYISDIPELADVILTTDSRVSFVIDKIKEVTEPISEYVRRLGVRSLRESIKEPKRVVGLGEIKEAAGRIVATLGQLRSPKVRKTLLKRLDALGVESELVWHDWFDRVSAIRAIRFAPEVEATYLFHGKKYRWSVDAGFDQESGTFWITNVSQDALTSFCESLAAQLILKPNARPVHRLALHRALETEISELTFGRVKQSSEESGTSGEVDPDQAYVEADVEEGETGEAVFGHEPFEPNPLRNLPTPAPLPSTPQVQTAGTESRMVWQREIPAIEKEHRDSLKAEHYASHCQMCLCERPPAELAPRGSYVEWEEVRRRVLDAHHVDPKSGGGARHAGNLILLCKFHHDNYGRRLTRQALTMALQQSAHKRTIRFTADGSHERSVIGRVARVTIPDTGEIVSIFFTIQHANYWLSAANLQRRK